MIDLKNCTPEWIKEVSEENSFSNIVLIEKTIRAFMLLESLILSGCPFVFKGGTALMLHLNSEKRLSIDIDIICPPETDLEQYLSKYAHNYGFNNIKLIERKTSHHVPKSHAKYYYQAVYTTSAKTEYILLDVLFDNVLYNKVLQLPVQSRFLKTRGETVYVNLPSSADLLGDKLTAFAPNTTGIPYYKGDKLCSMEIVKQLYDIASLFDIVDDLATVSDTFHKFAAVELAWRNLDAIDIKQVFDDIYKTSLCICLQGAVDNGNFRLLQDGIKRIQNFIHGERYLLDTAIVNASKAAYLSVLIEKNITVLNRFDKNNIQSLQNDILEKPLNTKLNKLKKSNIEAFFYWNEIQKHGRNESSMEM